MQIYKSIARVPFRKGGEDLLTSSLELKLVVGRSIHERQYQDRVSYWGGGGAVSPTRNYDVIIASTGTIWDTTQIPKYRTVIVLLLKLTIQYVYNFIKST